RRCLFFIFIDTFCGAFHHSSLYRLDLPRKPRLLRAQISSTFFRNESSPSGCTNTDLTSLLNGIGSFSVMVPSILVPVCTPAPSMKKTFWLKPGLPTSRFLGSYCSNLTSF